VERVSVIGSSGSGKTTVALALAGRLAVPHLELDGVFHQPGWQQLDRETFQARVRSFTAGPRWVIDGNYVSHGVAHLVWARADTIVWLDLPRWQVMAQVVPRTLRRALTGAELWNGNRERWRNMFDRRPEENVMLWAWTRHAPLRESHHPHPARRTPPGPPRTPPSPASTTSWTTPASKTSTPSRT
jgi:adenylate kinase family enzyme